MANVYGGADGVLVGAAYRAAMANVPLDMSGVYKQRELNLQTFVEGVGELMKPKVDYKEGMNKMIQANAQAVEELMYNGDVLGDEKAYMDLHTSVVERFEKAVKDTPNTKEGNRRRMDITREMNKYKNTMANSKELVEEMLSNSVNNDLYSDLDSNERDLWNVILDDYANKTNNAKISYDNGDIMYTLPDVLDDDNKPITMTMSDIRKGLSSKDTEFLTTWAESLNKIKEQGQNSMGKGGISGLDMDELVNIKNNMVEMVRSEDHVRNLRQYKSGRYSFDEVITGQAKDPITGVADTTALDILYKELENMGGVDMTGDNNANTMVNGVNMDKEEWTNSANGVKLLEKLDKHQLKELVIGFQIESAVKDFYKQGEEIRAYNHTSNLPTLTKGQQETKTKIQTAYKTINTTLQNKNWRSLIGGKYSFREMDETKGTGKMIWDAKEGKKVEEREPTGNKMIALLVNGKSVNMIKELDPADPNVTAQEYFNYQQMLLSHKMAQMDPDGFFNYIPKQ